MPIASRRVVVGFESLFSSRHVSERGVVRDLSRSGARIETQAHLAQGAPIRLYLIDSARAHKPIELAGRVARLTDTGFAIGFDPVEDAEVLRWIDDVVRDEPDV